MIRVVVLKDKPTEVGVESPGRQDFSLRSRIAPLLQKLGPSSEGRVRACPGLFTPTSVQKASIEAQ